MQKRVVSSFVAKLGTTVLLFIALGLSALLIAILANIDGPLGPLVF